MTMHMANETSPRQGKREEESFNIVFRVRISSSSTCLGIVDPGLEMEGENPNFLFAPLSIVEYVSLHRTRAELSLSLAFFTDK